MVSLLHFYHFTALCSSESDLSVSAICYLWRFFSVHYYIGRSLYVLLWPPGFLVDAELQVFRQLSDNYCRGLH